MSGHLSKDGVGFGFRGNRGKAVCLAVLLVGVLIRAFSFHAAITDPSPRGLDEVDYRQLASNILDHKTFSTWTAGFRADSTRPPVYSLLIAAAYASFGDRGVVPPRVLNFFLDLLAIFLMFLLGRMLAGRLVGCLAAALYALFGHSPYYASQVGPHTTSVALVLLVSLALFSLRSRYWAVLPGFVVLFVILIHLRPVFLLVSPFLALIVYFQLPTKEGAGVGSREGEEPANGIFGWLDWRRIAKASLPVLLVALLCVPWGVRNYRRHGMLIPVCTVAGWHLGGASVYDTELPVAALMENIYAPEREGFSEAEYYGLAKRMFFDALWRHPVLLPAFGFARLVVGWSPPGPWWRCFLPKAYVFPLKIGRNLFFPLIDFEGLIYVFVFSVLLGVILLGKQLWRAVSRAWKMAWPLFVFVAVYALAHVIGFPLPTYRFIIEPAAIALGCVFLACLVLAYVEKRGLRVSFWKTLENGVSERRVAGTAEVAAINGAAAVFLVLLAVPWLAGGKPCVCDYNGLELEIPPGMASYAELRKAQWRSGGGVPSNAVARVAGVVRYLDAGYRHSTDEMFPVRDSSSTAGRLFVEYGSPERPLGVGDVKVNFRRGDAPKEGEAVVVDGRVSVGEFKWIIIDVDKWSPLPTIPEARETRDR